MKQQINENSEVGPAVSCVMHEDVVKAIRENPDTVIGPVNVASVSGIRILDSKFAPKGSWVFFDAEGRVVKAGNIYD